MKPLLVKLVVVLIGLAIFGYAEVWGADWRIYAKPESGIGVYYYDADGITRPSKNIVRVWEKVVYSAKGVKRYVEESGKRYENLSHSLNLWEFDCVEKKERILQTTEYSKDGTVLSSTQSQKTPWNFISPTSIGEALYEAVCK